MVATAESFSFSVESAVSFAEPAQPVRRRSAGRRRRRKCFLEKNVMILLSERKYGSIVKKLRIRPFSNKCRRSGKRQTESVTLRKKISYHHIAGVIHLSRKDTKSCVRQKRGSSFLQIFDTFWETGLRYPAELCLVELVVRALFCHQFEPSSDKIRSDALSVFLRISCLRHVVPLFQNKNKIQILSLFYHTKSHNSRIKCCRR